MSTAASTRLTKSIKHQPSRLDLLDDSTLTSLPLPPPPPLKRLSNQSSQNSATCSIKQQKRQQRRRRSQQSCSDATNDISRKQGKRRKSIDTREKAEMNGEEVSEMEEEEEEEEDVDEEDDDEEDCFEYSYDDEDPIVLVEDYLSTHNVSDKSEADELQLPNATTAPLANHHLSRQESLANFKQRILSTNNVCLHEPILENSTTSNNNNNSYNNNNDDDFISNPHVSTNIVNPRPLDDLQAIFGNLPSFKLLKYCDLCEKPLYEISSIINSKKSTNLTQFICGDCIDNYEIFWNEYSELQSKQEERKSVEEEEKEEQKKRKAVEEEEEEQKKRKAVEEEEEQKKRKVSTVDERLFTILKKVSQKYNVESFHCGKAVAEKQHNGRDLIRALREKIHCTISSGK
ncbi:hypothetical protein KGF56_003589 [Candida oxycetoniae]|uniref:Uncharacterized protein n=1 Tax=Candida oxycetoniae TaxID=497107 RepID=A0AAI9SVE4_9ASCO|nr:uncharacterized protein KGF56_003589 [Candida oxycetoniae]KAI3403662.2 hypothetical protein KGF56_003589 [Candida oxycetoniae]